MKPKTILRILMLIILVCLVIFITNIVATSIVITDVYTSMAEKADTNNFYSKITNIQEGTNKLVVETWIKDNIYKVKQQMHYGEENELINEITILEKNESNKEYNEFYFMIGNGQEIYRADVHFTKSAKEPENKFYKYSVSSSFGLTEGIKQKYQNFETYNFIEILKICLKNPNILVKTERYENLECYAINIANDGYTYYINKETMLPIARINGTDSNILKYEYLSKEVTDEDVQKPDFSNINGIEFNDTYNKEEENIKYPEKPISGTNLKVGESLVKNIEVMSDECLNLFNLKTQKDGIKHIEILQYDTYQIFKTKYKNLPNLSKEDFESYRVSLIYKDGYKLNFKEEYKSVGNYKNFVLTENKSNKENILVIVHQARDIEDKLVYYYNFVLKNNEININPNQAIECVENNLEEIRNAYAKEKENTTLVRNVDILENINLSSEELFYKVDNLKEDIITCWKIECSVLINKNYQNEYVEVFVNAKNGELIGAKIRKV